MLRRVIQSCCLCLLIVSCFLPAVPGNAQMLHTTKSQETLADFPTVDPDYIYDQLFYVATHFLHRETGYDKQLAATVNGHDEFADYWAQEMQKNLQGFGVQVVRDSFTVKGWKGHAPTVPAFNVEASVPGLTHPEQVVVIGCHYDGEAVSTQSAYDDASGCAIELGVARAMASYWRVHHVYPARTLRFVIFDAEEQGLYGSFHYLNSTINGDIANIVAMFNEEQNGIAYPLRYLGRLTNPLMPFYTELSPLKNNDLYAHQEGLKQEQRDRISRFNALMQQAVPAAFRQFRALGYDQLTYHSQGKDVAQPIFADDQQRNVTLEEDTIGSSDQMPFTLAGLPCATFLGNTTFYGDPGAPGSYPYDQKEDTIQLMNTFANGSEHKSYALALALGLPGMLTSWMLNQPDILGQAVSDKLPVAAINDIGLPLAGKELTLDATASLDPDACAKGNCATPNFSYAWDFGDGSKGSGATVKHTYNAAGDVTLMLTVNGPAGKRVISKKLSIVEQASAITNPYQGYEPSGSPQYKGVAAFPTPDNSLSDNVPNKVVATPALEPTRAAIVPTPIIGKTVPGIPPGIYVIISVAVVLLILFLIQFLRRRSQKSALP